MTKLTAKEQAEIKQHRAEVIETVTAARALALEVFGPAASSYAVHQIANYIEEADLEEFHVDLLGAHEDAKKIYETKTPTAEDVFDLFERLYLSDEDGDDDDE